jgi:hypothetical protein
MPATTSTLLSIILFPPTSWFAGCTDVPLSGLEDRCSKEQLLPQTPFGRPLFLNHDARRGSPMIQMPRLIRPITGRLE